MRQKILITGGSGLLGSNLTKIASGENNISFTYNRNLIRIPGCTGLKMNLTELKENDILDLNPDIIIHCAALTDVDYCEDHQNKAYNTNVETTKRLAEISKKLGSKLIYVSTDSVFDGSKGNYTETETPNPINFYAKTKLLGEEAVRGACDNFIVIRTNIYGWNIQNKLSLAEWMIDKLKNREPIKGFNDVFFSPILVNNLSEAILEMCENNMKGTFNVSGSERISKFHFARKLADVFGYDESLISPISVDEMNFKAKRPKDTSLNVSEASKSLETKLLDVEDGLKQMKTLEESGWVKELKDGLS